MTQITKSPSNGKARIALFLLRKLNLYLKQLNREHLGLYNWIL
jgi:hypothetical protein